MKLHYHIVDVFTDRAFGGNPLAVFTDGGAVPETAMQSIARELNLSETTFVLPAEDRRNDFRVRIFTPATELPMAGHPTVGTAFVLEREALVRQSTKTTPLRFEEGVGVIAVSINHREDAPAFIEMTQPLPKFGPVTHDSDSIAKMLSLDPGEVRDTGLPIQTVSCGVPFLFVPLRDLAAARKIRLRADLYDQVRNEYEADNVFAFTREVESARADIHSRMFAPALGVAEDPATGGASGPLGCYLVLHRVLPSDKELRCVSEQGLEMGRPSLIHIRIEHAGAEISGVAVGGTCHYMGAGWLDL
jgi:trans-2,3-dihydro-3-hydroxyanthranilate isomerase